MSPQRWSPLKRVLKVFQSRQVMKPKNVPTVTVFHPFLLGGDTLLSLQRLYSQSDRPSWLRSGSTIVKNLHWFPRLGQTFLSKIGILTGPCHCLFCCLQRLSVTKQKPFSIPPLLPCLPCLPCLWRLYKLQINKLFALFSGPAPGLRWGKWPEHVIFLVSCQPFPFTSSKVAGSKQGCGTLSRAQGQAREGNECILGEWDSQAK